MDLTVVLEVISVGSMSVYLGSRILGQDEQTFVIYVYVSALGHRKTDCNKLMCQNLKNDFGVTQL